MLNVTGNEIDKAELLEHLKEILAETVRQRKNLKGEDLQSYYTGFYSGQQVVLRELIDDLEYY